MAKVSVIVPIYKVEKYIHQCLDSLVNQTLTDIEIILIDDGSPDNCGNICDEYAQKDNRIRVIHKKNEGVSAARNDGIKESTSKWIMFVDSDDWCELNMCEVAYQLAEEKNVDIAIFNHYNNYDNFEKINGNVPTELFLSSHEDIEKLQMTILHNKYIKLIDNNLKYYMDLGTPWTKIFNKNIIIDNNIQFDTDVKGVFDDAIFCINVLEKTRKVYYKNIPLYHYRRLDTSLCNCFKPNNIEIYDTIFKKIRNFMNEKNKSYDFECAYYARIIIYFCKLIRIYFFNKLNTKLKVEIFKELKETMHSNPYNIAAKNVNMKFLSKKQKVYTILIKIGNPYFIFLFYKLETARQRIKDRKERG